MKNTFFVALNLLILSFFIVTIPAYYFFQSAVAGQIRNGHFFVSIAACIFLSITFLRERKNKNIDFLLLLLSIFFSWVLLVLLIGIRDYNIERSISDAISVFYCFQALVLGINLAKISNSRFLSSFIFMVWLANNVLIASKVDPVFVQAMYGKENESFVGVYQYIGDTYALTSVMLVSGAMSTLKKVNPKQANSLSLLQEEFQQSTILPIILLALSIIFLFLNGSRASLLSFLVFAIYILHRLLKRISLFKIIFTFFSLFLLISILLGFAYDLPIYHMNYDVLLSNRNLEIFTEGHSTSVEDRSELYELGIQDIDNNPMTGNYIERNLYRGRGSYIHNFLSIIQDFGIFAFLSYGCLIFYCVKYCFNSSIKAQDYHSINYNGFLIMSIMQIVFFREALGFYPIFINFGMMLRARSAKNQ